MQENILPYSLRKELGPVDMTMLDFWILQKRKVINFCFHTKLTKFRKFYFIVHIFLNACDHVSHKFT